MKTDSTSRSSAPSSSRTRTERDQPSAPSSAPAAPTRAQADAEKAAKVQAQTEATLAAQCQPLPSKEAVQSVGGTPSPLAPTASPRPAPAPRLSAGLQNAPAPGTHVVQPGETMGGIAQQHDVPLDDVIKANPQVADPNVIHPGDRLSVPGMAAPPPMGTHVVQPGETMTSIAKQNDVSLGELIDANPQVPNPDLIYPDQRLNVPLRPGPAVDTTPPAQPVSPAADEAPVAPAPDAPPPAVDTAPPALPNAPAAGAPPAVDTAPAAPAAPADPGVFRAPAGFDIENPPPSFDVEVSDGQGGKRTLSVNGGASERLGPNGEEMVTISVGVGEGRGQGAELDLGPATIEGAVFAGEATEYSVTIPADHYREVLAGNAPFPNPGDLSTLPEGSTATMTAETFAGLTAGVSRGAFDVSADVSFSEGTTIGLEVGADAVRVMAGPTESFNTSVNLGAGFDVGAVGASVEFSLGNSVRNTELQFLDLDREGGQAALQDFVATGQLPPPDAEGVLSAGTIRQIDASEGAKLSGEIDLGPLSFGGDILGSGRDLNVTEVAYTTGERELSFALNERGVGAFATARFDAEGRRVDGQIGLTLDDVSPETSRALYGHFADDQRSHSLEGEMDRFRFPGGAVHDVQVEMTADEYTALRDRAVEAEIARYADTHSPLSADEVAALRAGDLDGVNLSLPPDRVALLANPSFFGFITDSRNGLVGAEGVAQALHRAAATDPEQRGLPGTGSFYVDDPAFD